MVGSDGHLRGAAGPDFRHEAAVLCQVMRFGRHPGIVPLLRTHLDSDPPCLEYEHVEGGDLADFVRLWPEDKEDLWRESCRLLCELAEAVAFAHGVFEPAVDADLHGRLGGQRPLGVGFDIDTIVHALELRLIQAEALFDEQIERRLGCLELVALVLQVLHQVAELDADLLVVLDCVLGGLGEDVRLPRKLADQDAALVADQGRVDVLVARRHARHAVGVHAALVRER